MLPSNGVVARWGGEEFLVVMPKADEQKATKMAHALVKAVAAKGLRHEASMAADTVTISVGVAVVDSAHSLPSSEELIAQADMALYRAKHSGRNRYVLASFSAKADQTPRPDVNSQAWGLKPTAVRWHPSS